ncbi:hypothetical protein TNCV_745181 [Trichonephila clavipes]|nr:hypothetical protein TNCV_745181 [Trichonephila clavipes]
MLTLKVLVRKKCVSGMHRSSDRESKIEFQKFPQLCRIRSDDLNAPFQGLSLEAQGYRKKDLEGIYPLCVIFAHSGPGKALPQGNDCSNTNGSSLTEKTAVFTTWLGKVVHLKQKLQFRPAPE